MEYSFADVKGFDEVLMEFGKCVCICVGGDKLTVSAGDYESSLIRIFKDGDEIAGSPFNLTTVGSIGIEKKETETSRYSALLYGYNGKDRANAVEIASICW
jgi:hypothetical protein